jgi:SNF family Na+-dependent transporter
MRSAVPSPPADRDESADQRADRNWSELLQELRVLQTGTQILTGFLLALAFQAAFANLSDAQRAFYLALVVIAAVSAIIALAPVALHRLAFRHHVKPRIVSFGQAMLVTALATVSVLLTGVVAFVFDVVVGLAAAWIAAIVLAMLIVGLWVLVPVRIRAARAVGDADARVPGAENAIASGSQTADPARPERSTS